MLNHKNFQQKNFLIQFYFVEIVSISSNKILLKFCYSSSSCAHWIVVVFCWWFFFAKKWSSWIFEISTEVMPHCAFFTHFPSPIIPSILNVKLQMLVIEWFSEFCEKLQGIHHDSQYRGIKFWYQQDLYQNKQLIAPAIYGFYFSMDVSVRFLQTAIIFQDQKILRK